MHNRSFTLEAHETQDLLDRLKEWRLGICPNGTLGSEACFVLDQMPSIVLVPESAKSLTTSISTGSKWTCNLVDIGVISDSNPVELLQTLADSYMIFKSLFQNRAGSLHVAHAIRVLKYATIAIDNILRPTEGLKASIEGVLSEPNEEVRWNRLMGFWDIYGYFWPRKITLGFKGHYSKTVNLNDDDDVHFKLKQQMDKMETGKDPYDLHDFINNAVIVARQDLIPIHELLDIQHDEKVKDLIQRRFNQISVGSPIKMYNSASDCYLAWSPRHSDDNYGDDFVVRPLPGNDQLSTRSDKQCLWQLAWPTLIEQPHASSIIRAGTCICVHPACKTKLRKRINPDLSYTVQVDTQNRMLVCQPSQMDSDPKATIRPLRLKTPGELLNENNTTWRIEYPSSDSQITLDIDQSIHKLKPVVEGDTIQLKQMGVLTAFDTDLLKMTDKTFIQSLRKVKRIRKLDGSKTKSRMALMCIDQQDALNGYSNNTYWTIQLATADDVARCHYALKNDFAEQDDSLVTFESSTDQESDIHCYSEVSIPTLNTENNSNTDNNNRAHYLESLAKTSTSQLLADLIKRVTIDPFTHIIPPLRAKESSNTDNTR